MCHIWSDVSRFKRKFCNICRKRLEDFSAVRCEGMPFSTDILFIYSFIFRKEKEFNQVKHIRLIAMTNLLITNLTLFVS